MRRDSRQIINLLELVFNQELRGSARNAIAQPPQFWDFWTRGKPAVPGFVYQHNHMIVGNVSLLEAQSRGRYLIANVAVHPDYRRKGIARQMMRSLIQYTKKRSGKTLVLQVEASNQGAIDLYQALGFEKVGTLKQWHMNAYSLRKLTTPPPVSRYQPDHYERFHLRPLRNDDAAAVLRLDRSVFPLEMNWPEYPTLGTYKRGIRRWFTHAVNGQQHETWLAVGPENEIFGIGTIQNNLGQPYFLNLRLEEHSKAYVERILLGKLIRRLQFMRPKRIHISHLADNTSLENLIQEAGFKLKRTLDTMIYTF